MKPQMLVYQMAKEKADTIRNMVLPLGISLRMVTEEDASKTLETLVTEETFSEKESLAGSKEALVMCGFSQLQFSLVMGLFSRKKLPKVPVKAMMTDTNKTWMFRDLVEEIWDEHNKMHQKP